MPSITSRKDLVATARIVAALGWIASADAVSAQHYAPPPDANLVCPAIDEDGMLCAADDTRGMLDAHPECAAP